MYWDIAESFFLCSLRGMTRIDPDRVANALLDAPGWARVGITAPRETTRQAAAQELALTITRLFEEHPPIPDPDQLVLAL
jgi:hypothetical protein